LAGWCAEIRGKDSACILKVLNGREAEFLVLWTRERNIGEEMVVSMEAVQAGNSVENPAEEVARVLEVEGIEATIDQQVGAEEIEALAEQQRDEGIEATIDQQVGAEEIEALAEQQRDEEIEAGLEEQAALTAGSLEEPASVVNGKVPSEEEGSLSDMAGMAAEDWDYQRPRRGEVRTGVILSIGEQEIIVDVGAKRDGIVPYGDMQRMGEEALAKLRVGSEVVVYVLRPEDQEGNLLLSLYMAREQQAWMRAQELADSGETWEEQVIGYNKGGLVIPLDEIRGFVPASQVPGFPHGLSQEERLDRLSSLVGETLPVKVIEINRRKRRLILSSTAAQQDWRKQARTKLLSDLREGQVREGVVSSLCSFGAFVDLGGADGLVHLSELSWRRIRHPREAVSVGEKVEVYVLRLDHEKQRIGLSLKRLLPEPWALVEDKYELGQLVEGVVTNVVDFGAFAEVEDGVEGLIHVSELAEAAISHPREVVKKGDLLLLRVIRIDTRRKRLGLSLKRVLESEWAEWAARLAAANVEEQAAAEKAEEPVAEVAEVVEAVEGPVAEVAEVVEAVEEPVVEAAEEIVEAVEEPVVEAAEEIVETVVEPVAEVAEVVEAVEGPVAEVAEVVEAVEEPVAEAAEKVVEAVEEPVAEAAEEVVEAVEEPVAEAAEEIVEAVEEPVVEAAEEIVEAVVEPVVEAAEEIVEAVEEPVAEAAEEVVEAMEEPVAEMAEVVEAVVEPVVEAEPAVQEEEAVQDPEPAVVEA
jgi:small subunit ribosomal protein S1